MIPEAFRELVLRELADAAVRIAEMGPVPPLPAELQKRGKKPGPKPKLPTPQEPRRRFVNPYCKRCGCASDDCNPGCSACLQRERVRTRRAAPR